MLINPISELNVNQMDLLPNLTSCKRFCMSIRQYSPILLVQTREKSPTIEYFPIEDITTSASLNILPKDEGHLFALFCYL